MIITFSSTSAVHKKTPKISNVVLSYKPGDTFEVKQACTLGHHKVKAGSTLQIQFYKRGSDQLSLDHIDKSEGLTFFTVSVADFIDAQKCLKKLNSSVSKTKQDATEKEKLRKLRLKHAATYEEIRKQKTLMAELRKRKRELKERGKRVNIPPQDVLRHEQHLASLYKKLPLSLRSETMNNYIKKYGKATVTRPAMHSSR